MENIAITYVAACLGIGALTVFIYWIAGAIAGWFEGENA
jgi:hypothetical protein